jgi:uncharacterized OsmC-like protein
VLVSHTAAIRTAFARNREALARRPSRGRGTAVTTVRTTAGLACEVVEGPWRLVVDMGDRHGGNDSGPNPGILGRGALGACVAIAWQLWAAHLGVELAGLEVEVQADYDAAGLLADDGGPAGYRQVRCVVTVTSDAPAAELARLADVAATHSPYLDVFARPLDVQRELRVVRPGHRTVVVPAAPGQLASPAGGSGSAAACCLAPTT